MSKWRPSPLDCIYVIPDIHGQYDQLKLILNRILPLRKSDGGSDILVFLGDYVDRRADSHKVIDELIQLQKDYPKQVFCLMGNHELMLLDAIKPSFSSNHYLFWMRLGGAETLSGYLDRAGQHMDNPFELMRNRVIDMIPDDHLNFIRKLKYYYETDDHIFVHGGLDPMIPVDEQKSTTLAWDRELYTLMKSLDKSTKVPWQKTIVTGHNGDTGEPYIHPKFMMLDCQMGKLLVLELNSMEGMIAETGNKRLIKVKY